MKKLLGLTFMVLIYNLNCLTSTVAYSAEPHSGVIYQQSCQSNEKWTWTPELTKTYSIWIHEFEKSISPKGSFIRGFSEALALRKMAYEVQTDSPPETQVETQIVNRKAFRLVWSEYWISRSLYTAGLVHLAERGFDALLKRPVTSTTAPFQLAALSCLSTIHRKYSSIELNPALIPQIIQLNQLIPTLSRDSHLLKPAVWGYAFYLALEQQKFTPELLTILKGSGHLENLISAIQLSSQDSDAKELNQKVFESLQQFFHFSHGSSYFKSYLDRAHLLAARAAYTMGKYPDSIRHYKVISVRSNEWVHALSELSWAYLMSEHYQEAIGAAIGLQSGGLKHTFAPEATMVMAISLNEMCRFPESMNVIQSFKRTYKDTFLWLKSHLDPRKPHPENLYPTAIAYARNHATPGLPNPVGSEWIRSTVFIHHQERINLLAKERDLIPKIGSRGKTEQQSMAVKLLQEARVIQKRILEKGKSAAIAEQLNALKQEFIHYRHLKTATPFWRKILANYEVRVPQIKTAMIEGVNQEIHLLNERMMNQLEEIAENNEMIEIEILNGASEDLIWQNAHPGFKDAAKNMKQLSTQPAADRVWDWGTTQGGLSGQTEIWEDEIGSLTANLDDHCESKDKYLMIEQKQIQQRK